MAIVAKSRNLLVKSNSNEGGGEERARIQSPDPRPHKPGRGFGQSIARSLNRKVAAPSFSLARMRGAYKHTNCREVSDLVA